MFITLEGIEGSGKTTQIDFLVQYFENQGRQCVTTREPGGTPIGGKIRAILLAPESEDLDPTSELLLYMADRAQHINSVIKPSVAAGKIVVCDRYFDATLVYQGFARELDIGIIQRLHALLFDNLKPDLTFLLDLEPREGLARAWKQIHGGQRSNGESRFEKETLAFHKKVRAGYLELARLEPDRFRIIDATRDVRQVRGDIYNVLNAFLRRVF
jgi:dTMP kinase